MCGILGYISPGKPIDLPACLAGTEAIAHRGPDGFGAVVGQTQMRSATYFGNPDKAASGLFLRGNPDYYLGHRRLAVIDLTESAAQPMSNETKRVWVVFNGEIYNHAELRSQLVGLGHHFQTDHSDTEVLVHGYEEWGKDVVDRLRGMFAFAILDLNANRLFMARDRFGEKPLYYCCKGGTIAFSSELKGLLHLKNISGPISQEGLFAFLHRGYAPAPMSIFRDVRKLRAAERITIRLDCQEDSKPETYWDFEYQPEQGKSDEQWQEEFCQALTEAVRLRIISDVPLGTFLSGGLDSTVITNEVSRLVDKKVKAFSIGFPNASHDERAYSLTAAQTLGLDHHMEVVTPEVMLATIPQITEIYDEPFANSSAIPTLAVSRLARKHVTVALSGDGGDELLAGYTRYRWQNNISRFLDCQPDWFVKKFIGAIRQAWPQRVRGRGLLDKFIPGQKARYLSVFSDDHLASLASTDFVSGQASIPIDAWPDRSPTLIDAMCSFDRRFYIPEDMMVKVDRTSMSVSLEARAPLLDHKLFELVGRMPLQTRFDGKNAKLPFKKLLSRRFDSSFIERPKKGFAVPIGKWFRNELADELNDVVCAPNSFVSTILHPKKIKRLISAHKNGSRDQSPRLWKLFVLEKWHARYGKLASTTTDSQEAVPRVA